jgi:hypothetical protein
MNPAVNAVTVPLVDEAMAAAATADQAIAATHSALCAACRSRSRRTWTWRAEPRGPSSRGLHEAFTEPRSMQRGLEAAHKVPSNQSLGNGVH